MSLDNRKSAAFFLLAGMLLLSFRLSAQPLIFTSTYTTQCFTGNGSTTSTLMITSTPPATSYTWQVGSLGCTANFVNTTGNGTLTTISYPCCGTFSIVCSAYNGTTLISTTVLVTTVVCPPSLVLTPFVQVCAGNSTVLSVFGAQNYTWAPNGQMSSAISVTPTGNTTYTVIGSNSFGCTDTASVNVTTVSPPNPSFLYNVGPNGLVNFVNTSANANVYSWAFGNGITSTLSSPVITYTSNGVYSVTLTASNSGCSSSTVIPVTVTNVVGSCIASFVYSISPGGAATFSSTSSGTLASTTYSWDFGNGITSTATGVQGQTASVTYTSNGTYTVNLYIINAGPSCSTSIVLTCSTICNLNAGFTSTQTNSNTLHFSSTSSGTNAGTIYMWNYGDGFGGAGSSSFHSYNSPGVYTVTLTITDGNSCTSIRTATVMVSACNLLSNFTHTVGANGSVWFTNTSVNTNSLSKYYWDFGDGIFSLAQNPTHTYSNAGIYYVTLKILDSLSGYCSDSLTQSINITNIPCQAISNFTINTTPTPQYWNAIPSYPWNIMAATWYWGDGTQSNTLYTSHVYSVAGTYSICLSVTVSCGTSSSYCLPYTLNKTGENAPDVLNVNVVPPGMSTGIEHVNQNNIIFTVYPNPSEGFLHIQTGHSGPVTVEIYDLLGNTVYSEKDDLLGDTPKEVHLNSTSAGIYFVRLSQENRSSIQKIIINK